VVRTAIPRVHFDQPISCHHNYVAAETYGAVDLLVTRKGAIRVGVGDLGIIPGSMGTGTYIVRGRGNEDAYCSASHGTGRRMSRSKAKKTFTVEDPVWDSRSSHRCACTGSRAVGW
jgi:tRNA-splicing ligase RtcB